MLKKIKDAAWEIVKSKWYWILALLVVTVIVLFFLGYKRAAVVLILGIVTIISVTPEAFLAAGIGFSVVTGIILAARAKSAAVDTAKVAFALLAIGTLLGAWRLWRTGREHAVSTDSEPGPD